jgi:hypothetical protein
MKISAFRTQGGPRGDGMKISAFRTQGAREGTA